MHRNNFDHIVMPLNSAEADARGLHNQAQLPRQLAEEATQQELSRFRRRVDRIKRTGLFSESDHPIVITQALSLQEKHEAYKLVHDVFVFQGYIAPQPGGMRIRPFETDPNTATFVAKINGKLVGVMSIVVDSQALGLPSDKIYKKEIDRLRSQGRKIGESSNLAVAPDQRNTAVFMELSRCCTAHAANIGLDDIIISISPGHAMFFEILLGFITWGECRNYGDETVDHVELKRLNLDYFARYLQFVDHAIGDEAFLHDWFFVSNRHLKYHNTNHVDLETSLELD